MCDWTNAYAERMGEQRKGQYERWVKVDVGKFFQVHWFVKDDIKHTNGVEKSYQLIGKYNTLRKTNKWWKTLFLRFIAYGYCSSKLVYFI